MGAGAQSPRWAGRPRRAGPAAEWVASAVGEPALAWRGRVEVTADGARFSWPGTGFGARFDGTGLKVSLKTNAVDYFQLIVDDQVSLLTTQPGQHEYELAKSLPLGVHSVELWRRTEANAGSVELGGISFQGNLLAPRASSKRLEVVGDSISVGFGIECQTQNEPFSYATENNYQTYQAVAARSLEAELLTLAWSGIGMWRDVGGSTEATNQMPARYLRTLGNEAESVWDFARYTPGAVVVHLGTNDFAKGDPGQPFVDAYLRFVAGLRDRYPQARVYLAVSPMLGGERRTALKAHLAEVQSARVSAGDHNVALLEFAEPAAGAWGCGHPNGATHLLMADVLEQALRRDLGW